MPYITSVHESLPYVDPEPSLAQRTAAAALVAEERVRVPDDPHHALLRPLYEPKLTEAMQAEVARVAASHASGTEEKTKLDAIDLSRYEEQELPEGGEQDAAVLRAAVERAAVAQTYLRGRRAHLALLDRYGKNAWLVGNWQAEADLKSVEQALAGTRREVDVVTLRRQRTQQAAAGELQGLEVTWRQGVGRVLETEAAAEALRQRILEERRKLANADR